MRFNTTSDEESSLLSLYQKNKFEFLVELAFVKEKELSISLTFLQYIARTFLQAIANDPKFNFSKTPYDCEVDDKTICNIIENTPYIIGLEFVNKEWVLNILGKFNTAYKNVVQKSEKTPFEYILSKGNLFTVPSRIYFHLVENKDNDGYPFAFLATYTAIDNGKLIHCPLKNALTQLKSDKNKLTSLVSSITEATKESALIIILTSTPGAKTSTLSLKLLLLYNKPLQSIAATLNVLSNRAGNKIEFFP